MSGSTGTRSGTTWSRWSVEPNRSASPQAYRSATEACSRKSVGASMERISITVDGLVSDAARSALGPDQGVEPLAEVAGDRPGLAVAEGAAVALDDGDHLGGRA